MYVWDIPGFKGAMRKQDEPQKSSQLWYEEEQ